ncbi:Tetratricopeptide repeat 1 [Micractinium conductrix]|uniref:Tetratricopeptide repeat 1 n=1 Tax=Micractinium conductrix TaxID=554055 RepID=A0A2P6VSF3_9CHLO|nr:Tetratricopeptide repeat 1 [Micractinium conductrix]|eukprot:PSC77038.1 Tetratricopeptide repeat 1 [Micractinium conductrix]
MAKKGAAAAALSAEDAASLAQLKADGNSHFAKKEYDTAIACYDKALGMVPADAADAALLHSNKAACHMMHKRFKEAVSECTAALNGQPNFFKALVRRAKALEQLGQHKAALADIQRANRLDTANEDSREHERRLKEQVAGKKPAGMGNGLAKKTSVPAKAASSSGRQVVFPAKLSMGDDTRLLQLVPGVTYLELMEHVRQLYPAIGPFVLKFVDKEGDLVTVSHRNDIQRAMQESVEAASRGAGARVQLTQQALPPIRLQVVKVASEAEVPKIPEDEMMYVQQMLQQLQKSQAAQKAAQAQVEQPEEAQPPVQIDEWILQFVDLLKEHCGIDPDKPLECQEVGQDRLNAAFTSMMNEDAKAQELLGQAEEKFQDQVCYGMYNQATVHQYRAEFLLFKAAREGAKAASVSDEVEKHLKAAEAQLDAALAYKASFLDGYLGRSALAQLRAKVAADYIITPTKPRDDITDAKERAAAEETASKEAQKSAMGRVTPEGAKAADSFFETAYGHIGEAVAHMSEEDKAKEIKPMKPTAEQDPADPDSQTSIKQSLLINHGNAKYEHSILRAAGSLEWKPLVEEAAAKFRQAGAHPTDIRNALKGHPCADQMADIIGPEPEPEAPAAEDKKEEKEAPKGLPSLGKPGKKKESA